MPRRKNYESANALQNMAWPPYRYADDPFAPIAWASGLGPPLAHEWLAGALVYNCPFCAGNGWVIQLRPRVGVAPGNYKKTCDKCSGTGSRGPRIAVI